MASRKISTPSNLNVSTAQLLKIVRCDNLPQHSLFDEDNNDIGGLSSGNRTNLEINQINLDNVLSTVGSLPLYAVTVVGPQKQGKSLLLGYLIKYFGDRENPCDWRRSENMITGIKWPGESSPGVPGIWTYPRVFKLQGVNENNHNSVAVMLLYAQLGRKWSDEQNLKGLLGLTLSISSYNVIHIMDDLDENFLSILGSTMTLNLQTSQKANTSLPHKNVTLLVRDWNSPIQYPFGSSGGTALLNQKLSRRFEDRYRNVDMEFVRNKLDCFLLPPPGRKIHTAGPVALRDLDYTFTRQLEQFIKIFEEGLTPSQDLFVSASKWRRGLEEYIRNANVQDCNQYIGLLLTSSSQPVIRHDFLEKLSDKEQKLGSKQCVQKFNDMWRSGASTDSFLSQQDIVKVNQDSRKTAAEMLRDLISSKRFGKQVTEEYYTKIERQMRTELDQKWLETKALNHKKKEEQLEEAIEESVEEYQGFLKEAYETAMDAARRDVEMRSLEWKSKHVNCFREKFQLDWHSGKEDDGEGENFVEMLNHKLDNARQYFMASHFNPENTFVMTQPSQHSLSPRDFESTCDENWRQGGGLQNDFELSAEVNDRLKRSSRLVIMGIPENNKAVATVTQLLSVILPGNAVTVTEERIGYPKAGATRPFRVYLQSKQEVDAALQNCPKLKHHPRLNKIAVVRDETKRQRMQSKARSSSSLNSRASSSS